MTLILGIETSCDETAAAVVADGHRVLGHVVASQHPLHEPFHGVVPEIASRAHLERLQGTIQEALNQANAGLGDLDAIAVGNRPGLIGSLLVGVSAAQGLAWSTGKRLMGIDHVQAHLHAAFLYQEASPTIERRGAKSQQALTAPGRPSRHRPHCPFLFPALGLVVSGGHTSLYRMDSPIKLELLGRTIDDAVGEAYDKAAVILNLGYPGGPKLDERARRGNAAAHKLPRPLLGADSLDFSFSGLKTALLYKVRGQPQGRGRSRHFERSADDLSDPQRADLAAAFQQAAIDTLILKLERALEHLINRGRSCRAVVIGGGVSANSLLRRRVLELGRTRDLPVRIPAPTFCLDNAAMIAGLAHEHYVQGRFDDLDLPAIATTAS